LAGHSDVVLGHNLRSTDPALFKRLEEARRFNGSIPGPFEAWLALRGIPAPSQCDLEQLGENAQQLVTRLQSHTKITKVRNPGFGAVISFEVDGTAEQAEKVCESSRLITHATSLGGIESLWERRCRWALESPSVPEQLIRLSVGCEHVEDIWQGHRTSSRLFVEIFSGLASIFILCSKPFVEPSQR
jgi:cystathionine gamma-synthase